MKPQASPREAAEQEEADRERAERETKLKQVRPEQRSGCAALPICAPFVQRTLLA